MNNNYEFNSKKYILLLVVICAMFLILIIKAFDYLPQKEDNIEDNYNSVEYVNNINQPSNSDINDSERIIKKEQDEEKDKHKSGHIDFFKPNTNNYEKENALTTLTEIDVPSGVKEELPKVDNNSGTITDDNESALNILANAKKLKQNNDYSNALSELQKVVEHTDSEELKAISYEMIAEIYAINRRYGTALSFANKAYQTSPSASREMLIAKIYYQSGQTDTAINRINNALKKNFK